MSKFVKGVVKVFKKVGKFVLKVAPYVLAAAAIIYTGGAALGLGFAAGGFSAAVGGVVTSLGIGGAVGGALTGAITGAGMGAAVGGILGGKRGLKQGFITGAVTGGIMGGVSPGSVGVVKNADGIWTTKQGIINAANTASKSLSTISVPGVDLAHPALPTQGLAPLDGSTGAATGTAATSVPPPITSELAGSPDFVAQTASKGLNAGGALPGTSPSLPTPPAAAPAVAAPVGAPATPTPAPAPVTPATTVTPTVTPAATAPASGGIGGFFNANPALAGNMMTSIGSLLSGGEERSTDVVAAQEQAREDQANFAYGGAYSNAPNGQPFGNVNYGTPPPLKRGKWFYNPETDKVEEVPV